MLRGSATMSPCSLALPLSSASFFLMQIHPLARKKILFQFFPLLLNPHNPLPDHCVHSFSLPYLILAPFFPPPGSLSCFPSGEPVPECRRYVQVRNITKGDCRLDNVEVSFCRGRCLSRTDVTLEVTRPRMLLISPSAIY